MPLSRRIKLGVVANEFFDRSLGRMGGFGWAAKQVGSLFNEHLEFGVDAVFLNGELHGDRGHEVITNGTRMLLRDKKALRYWNTLRRERFDVLLTIDHRPNYERLFWMLPRTPIIIWVHDPRPPEDVEKVNSCRIPGDPSTPQGINPINSDSLATFIRRSRYTGRPIAFTSPAPTYLAPKTKGTYGYDVRSLKFMCNVMDFEGLEATVQKTSRPRVVFLGRLDPIKRPWVFAELAREFPETEFVFAGQNHFEGPGAWIPEGCPPNVVFAGHLDGRKKWELLSSSSILVNTSIHEALPISFLEALRCQMPILSCQDPESITSRFGYYVGRWDGDGMAGLPTFNKGLRWLLSDPDRLHRLGQEGRRWVEENHNVTRFVSAFDETCGELGVK